MTREEYKQLRSEYKAFHRTINSLRTKGAIVNLSLSISVTGLLLAVIFIADLTDLQNLLLVIVTSSSLFILLRLLTSHYEAKVTQTVNDMKARLDQFSLD